jgi:hypothetical protein
MSIGHAEARNQQRTGVCKGSVYACENVCLNILTGHHEIATTQKGMMIAIPESEWAIFSTMTLPELAQTLVDLAQHVRLEAFRKSPTRPKKSGPKPKKAPKKGHVSTAKLLNGQQAKATAP